MGHFEASFSCLCAVKQVLTQNLPQMYQQDLSVQAVQAHMDSEML